MRTGHHEEYESFNGVVSARENSEKTVDSCRLFNPEPRLFRYDRFSQRNSIEHSHIATYDSPFNFARVCYDL